MTTFTLANIQATLAHLAFEIRKAKDYQASPGANLTLACEMTRALQRTRDHWLSELAKLKAKDEPG